MLDQNTDTDNDTDAKALLEYATLLRRVVEKSVRRSELLMDRAAEKLTHASERVPQTKARVHPLGS
jgi:hypothetical protein